MMRRFVFTALLVASWSAVAQVVVPLTPQDAFDSGKEFGNTQSPNTKEAFNYAKSKGVQGFSGTGTKPGEALGSNYSDSTAPEGSYVSATGMSIMNSGGTDRIAECNALPASASYEKKIECESVKYLAGYVDNRPIIDQTTDPLLVGAKQVITAAKSETKNTEIPCAPTVNTGTDTVTQEVCQEMRPAHARACGETLTVNVGIQHVEKCAQGSQMPIYFSGWGGGVGYWIDAVCNNYVDTSLTLHYSWWNDGNDTKTDGGQSSFPILPAGYSPPPSDFNASNANAAYTLDLSSAKTYLSCNDDTCSFKQYTCSKVATGVQYDSETKTYLTSAGTVLTTEQVTGANRYLIQTPAGIDGYSNDLYDCNVPQLLSCSSSRPSAYCNHSFARPGIKEVITITDNWDDACKPYRATQGTPPAPFNNDKANTCYSTQTGTWATCAN